MFLRRALAHLKNQHWTAAGIDLVIVVLGVFIGMQVSNWNQQRVTDQQAESFTAHLKADLREEDWRYQLMIIYSDEVRSNAERAVHALEGSSPLTDEELLVSTYRATQYKQGTRRRATYDELISTGTIGLIREQALRDTAMRLYDNSTIDYLVAEGKSSRIREAFRMMIPTEVQRALARQCGDRALTPGNYDTLHGSLDYPCKTELPSETIAAAAKTLRANPDVVPFLRLRIADLDTRMADLVSNNRSILQGLRAVANEKP